MERGSNAVQNCSPYFATPRFLSGATALTCQVTAPPLLWQFLFGEKGHINFEWTGRVHSDMRGTPSQGQCTYKATMLQWLFGVESFAL